MTEITFWPILAAGVASVLIGWAWYHPKVFGTAWMRLTNITPEMAERGKKMMPLYALIALLASMMVAWTVNYIGIAFGIHDWIGAVFNLALSIWLGFVAPVMLGMVLWEQKPIKLYLINVLYWLVSLMVMALILVVGSQAFGPSSFEAQTDTSSYITQ